jgi:hypothetical protein
LLALLLIAGKSGINIQDILLSYVGVSTQPRSLLCWITSQQVISDGAEAHSTHAALRGKIVGIRSHPDAPHAVSL